MYQALYRKWRPKTFADVIGQNHITHTLRKQVLACRTSHAYLFTGSRGTGKTTCAKILAKAVNCQSPVDGDPCCQCPACVGIDNGTFLDVTELDAASNNGVDHVRALRDEAVYAPSHVKKRVYIVDEVHMLSTPAFNALLKILEEPPDHLLFILATTELHKVPPTILSRCQRYAFQRIRPEDIARRLLYVASQEKIDLSADGAELLSRLSDGAMRDALSLLDQCAASGGVVNGDSILQLLGMAGNRQTGELLDFILRRDAPNALLLFHQLYSGGKDVSAVLGELSTLVRDLLIRKTAPKGGSALLSGGYETAALDQWNQSVSAGRLLHLADVLQKTGSALHTSPNRRTDGELCLLRLCDESLCGDWTALEARISRLETEGVGTQAVGRSPTTPSDPPKQSKQSKTPSLSPQEIQSSLEDVSPPWENNLPDRSSSEEPPPIWECEPPPPVTSPLGEPPPFWDGDPSPLDISPPLPDSSDHNPDVLRPAVPHSTVPPSDDSSSPLPSTFDNDWWQILAEHCKAHLPPMYRVFLDRCIGTLHGDLLTVLAADDIVLARLDNDRVRETLVAQAAELTGHTVRLTLRVGTLSAQSPEENFHQLLKFSSQFENIKIK